MSSNKMPEWLAAGLPHIWRPYTQMKTASLPLPVVRTEGCKIYLADGSVLIDGVASWWTACHGYNHPVILQAVEQQLKSLPHIMFGGLAHEPAYTLAARLARLTPFTPHVFFSDSGSVAIEVALKIARKYWQNSGVPSRHRFISFRNGYHGDTLGAMSVGDPEDGMHGNTAAICQPSIPVNIPTDPVSRGVFSDLLDQHHRSLAGLIIEPLVQGAGGMRFHKPDVLHFIVSECQRRGILVIFDEVFTGFGRTGSMFAMEQTTVRPDILVVSKALTGGVLGLAATLTSSDIFNAFLSDQQEAALMHGPTFMANPLCCAAAHASLDLFEECDRLSQVQRLQTSLNLLLEPMRERLVVHDVRVLGAIGVVELKFCPSRDMIRNMCLRHGIWLRPLDQVIYVTPAFTMKDCELQSLGHGITAILDRLE